MKGPDGAPYTVRVDDGPSTPFDAERKYPASQTLLFRRSLSCVPFPVIRLRDEELKGPSVVCRARDDPTPVPPSSP